MVDIHHTGVAEAPLSVAFAYIDDTTNVPDWMFGISKFRAVDDANNHGLGAIYEGTFDVKPVKLKSVVEVTAWEQDARIDITSIKGFKNSSSWTFSAEGPTRTRLHVTFSYELPGGLAGRVLGKAMEPIVLLTVRHSDAALRKHIEAAYAAHRS